MHSNRIENLSWYIDREARDRDEPGLVHSFVGSAATVLNHVSESFDPVEFMGASGFAFRLSVNETLCPSAMSVFDFRGILPETLEQAGRHAEHITCLWDEKEEEQQRRAAAHGAIVAAVDCGLPPIVWDVRDAEWGVITGYNSDRRVYQTLNHRGEADELPFDRLGRNGIDILSVVIAGDANGRKREELIRAALRVAVDHADQREWTERPEYQNGLVAYDTWATIYDRWAMIVTKGDPDLIEHDLCRWSRYYAAHYYGARCYTRDYLASLGADNEVLKKAAACYKRVASHLRPVWKDSPQSKRADPNQLARLATAIRQAKDAEVEGLGFIREYLALFD